MAQVFLAQASWFVVLAWVLRLSARGRRWLVVLSHAGSLWWMPGLCAQVGGSTLGLLRVRAVPMPCVLRCASTIVRPGRVVACTPISAIVWGAPLLVVLVCG